MNCHFYFLSVWYLSISFKLIIQCSKHLVVPISCRADVPNKPYTSPSFPYLHNRAILGRILVFGRRCQRVSEVPGGLVCRLLRIRRNPRHKLCQAVITAALEIVEADVKAYCGQGFGRCIFKKKNGFCM